MISARTALALGVIASLTPAYANVVISTAATKNMSCSGGVCAPTAGDAVLNVSDLENLLASGNAKVTTTGSGVQARNIIINAAVSWSTSNALALDAYDLIRINLPVSVSGKGGVSLTTNGNPRLSFGPNGNVTFAHLSSSLMINGSTYKLNNTIAQVANNVAKNSGGNFALANRYDASGDGTYASAPIGNFSGTFEGLGNSISNLTINDGTARDQVGLFRNIAIGTVRNIGLINASVTSTGDSSYVGALVGYMSLGTVWRCYATGAVTVVGGIAGGLAGNDDAVISESYANVAVTGSGGVFIGGLVGTSDGTIAKSYATRIS